MALMRIGSRRKFVAGVLGGGAVGTLAALMREGTKLRKTPRMPVAFIGHGTPRSATAPNEWTASWEAFGKKIQQPSAILSISAHWLTQRGALVTANANPRMNYDFYGFPKEMYDVVYPAPGNPGLAQEVQTLVGGQLPVHGDTEWGFDHGPGPTSR